VPLAAAAGQVSAQNCFSALGTFTLTATPSNGASVRKSGGNYFFFPVGASKSAMVYLETTSPYRLLLAQGPGDPMGFGQVGATDRYALRLAASSTFSAATIYTYNAVFLCNGAGTGLFCPGDGVGFVPLRLPVGPDTLGMLELKVVSRTNNTASVYIGAIENGVDQLHAGDCASIVLPVELASFDAVISGDRVELNWATASELNNAGFELQRATKQTTFRKIAFVAGAGTTTEPRSYRFSDPNIEANVHYRYRLKQIDFDGTTSFSEVVEVFTENPSAVELSEIYPNPIAGGRATLRINIANDQEGRVEVFDVRGALVDSKPLRLAAGENRIMFDTDELAPGAHFVRVHVGNRTQYRQFVVSE
jgi:hypothetical protein